MNRIDPEFLWYHISTIWPDAICVWDHPQLGLIAYRGPELSKTIKLTDVKVAWPQGISRYPNAQKDKNS